MNQYIGLDLEKEKVELWSNKLDVAKSAMENKFFSKNWLYSNVTPRLQFVTGADTVQCFPTPAKPLPRFG